jgi:hypothetical protein
VRCRRSTRRSRDARASLAADVHFDGVVLDGRHHAFQPKARRSTRSPTAAAAAACAARRPCDRLEDASGDDSTAVARIAARGPASPVDTGCAPPPARARRLRLELRDHVVDLAARLRTCARAASFSWRL